MARFRIVFLVMVMGAPTFAQQRIDSLQRLLKSATSDSLRVEWLISLNGETEYLDIDKAREYLAEARRLAESNQWNWARLLVYRAESYSAMLLGDFTTSLRIDKQRLALAQSLGDSAQMLDALNYIGDSYLGRGEYDEAYFAFAESHRMAKQRGDSLGMAITTHNMGCLFNEIGQYDLALQHLAFARAMSIRLKDGDGEAFYLDEIGNIFGRQRDFAKAEAMLLKSLHITRARKIYVLEPHILAHLAEVYLGADELKKSASYWDSTLWLYQKTKNSYGIARAGVGRGRLLIQERNFNTAHDVLSSSLATAKKINARTLQIECLKQLASLNEQRGDLRSAYAYFKDFKALEDSLINQEMVEKIYRDQVRTQTELRDTEIAALTRAQQVQADELEREEVVRNILVVVAALSTVLLFTLYRSSRRKARVNKLLQQLQEETVARSEELEELNKVKDKFFSIISHDLRSPMNALAGILDLTEHGAIHPHEFPHVTKALRAQFDQTRKLIDNLLDWALLQMDKLRIVEEKFDIRQMVEENFQLATSLHPKRMEFVNNIPPGCMALADPNMTNLVFRNLIMNAIKFTDAGGTISIGIADTLPMWCISVRDTGVGIQPDMQKLIFDKSSAYSTRGTANEKGTGLGLILCKEFVERNGGKIWMDSQAGKGTTFFFTLKKA